MISPTEATQLGIVVQLIGAAYLVLQAYLTSRKLASFHAELTFDKFNDTLVGLAREVGDQFKQQLVGFMILGAGSALQLYGVA